MIFQTESYTCAILLVCMCSVNTFQTYTELYIHDEGPLNNLVAPTEDSIAQDNQKSLYALPSASNFKHGSVQEPTDQLHFVPYSSDHVDTSQGVHVSPAEWNDLAGILHSVLQISQLIPMLISVKGNQYENGMLKHIISKNTSLLSSLEEVWSTVQYFRSPEGLESEDRCTADVAAYLQGLEQGQMWALQMLDASGKPGRSILQGAIKFLGNYDECLDVSHTLTNESTGQSRVINGGYCHFLLTIPATVTNTTMKKYPIPIFQLHNTIQWDLCLPKSCNDSQVTEAVSRLPLHATGLSLISAYFTKVTDWKDDTVAVTTVFVMCFIVVLSIVGTLYDVICTEMARYRRARCYVGVDLDSDGESFVNDDGLLINITNENQFSVGSGKQKEQEDNAGLGRQLLLSFSIRRNTEKILSTRTGNGDLGCLHGIRVLSMAWVILGHATSWDGLMSYENVRDYADWTNRFTMQPIMNASLAVDTFFLLSGCLLTFLFLRECEKSTRGKPTVGQMVIYYIHRWLRLTPLYMIIIMVYSGLLDHLIDGPLAEVKNIIDKNYCRDNWWANLLYINNLYKTDEMCMDSSWFLANDMQFYVVAPLALLPLAYGFAWLGYCVISGLIAVHIISYGYLEWQTGGSSILMNAQEFLHTVYITPWCRVGVFAMGLLLGVILHRTKCKLKTRRYILVLGWLVFLAVGLLCCYITYDQMREADRQWGVNTRISYQILRRPAWTLFVSWVILVCCTGNGGVVNSILSWSAWIPLGRLTYGAYLIHPLVLSYTDFSAKSLRYADVAFVHLFVVSFITCVLSGSGLKVVHTKSYHYIGTFAVSYALSFITCVLVESPCAGLEKVVLTRLKPKK